MVIDGHVHIGETEKSTRHFTIKSYIKFARSHNISGAVIMPNISNLNATYELNLDLIKDVNLFENRDNFKLYPFLLIEPKNKLVLNQITRHRKEIYGLKYHPSVYRHVISSNVLKPYINKARLFKLPILVHCGRDKKSHISHLIKAATNNPDVNFIAAHLGGNASDLIDEAINILSPLPLPNIYLDTSAVKLPWLIERAVDELGCKRIIFGSDEPYADLRIAKYCIELADIEHKGPTFFRNILQLLGEINELT